MDKLISKIEKLNCPIAIGLDTSINFIPKSIKKQAIAKFKNTAAAAAHAIFEFNKKIVDATFDLVPAVKIQCAYYELFGSEGIAAMQKTISYAKSKNIFVIVDGKKNDIGASMQTYSDAYLGEPELLLEGTKFKPFDCDAITINPYLGLDSLMPIFENCKKFNKCAFILIKTSNPGSDQLQNLKLSTNELLYEKVAKICSQFDDYKNSTYNFSKIGAVVGATHLNDLKKLRKILPNTFFLVPGFGAQGATAKNVKLAFTNKTGAIVNNSRAILTAWQTENCDENKFAEAARMAVQKMKNEILIELSS